jgi:predicted double-glycine peptidase
LAYLSFIFAMPLFFGIPHSIPLVENTPPVTLASAPSAPLAVAKVAIAPATAATASAHHTLPFYSQFADIHSEKWKKVGCGIASLAMVIDYNKPHSVSSVDVLLQEGIDKDAYSDAGWTYSGLIDVAEAYGLTGESYDLGGLSSSAALARLSSAVEKGPVIASVHYTLTPTNPIPHLIVVYSIKDGVVRYNDPANKAGGSSISEEAFAKAWKQRYIEIYPQTRVATR